MPKKVKLKIYHENKEKIAIESEINYILIMFKRGNKSTKQSIYYK